MRHAVDRTDRVSSLSKEIWSGASFYVDLSKFQYFGLPLDYKNGKHPPVYVQVYGLRVGYCGTMLTLRNRAAPETDQASRTSGKPWERLVSDAVQRNDPELVSGFHIPD